MVEICGWLIWKCICVLFNCMLMIGKVILILNNPIFTVLLSLLALRCAYAVVLHFNYYFLFFIHLMCRIDWSCFSAFAILFCQEDGTLLRNYLLLYESNLFKSLVLSFSSYVLFGCWKKIKDESTQKSVIYLVTYFWYLKNTKPCYN